MGIQKLQPIRRLVTVSLVLLGLIPLFFSTLAFAGSNDNLPPRDTPDPTETGNLPPRETTVPTTMPPIGGESKSNEPIGSRIELRIEPFRTGLWTGVQWRDGQGSWYSVAGWQGAFNRQDYVSWFVEPKDFGKGPFRWMVFASPRGHPLAVSNPFYLPANEHQIIKIVVLLPENYNQRSDMNGFTKKSYTHRPIHPRDR